MVEANYSDIYEPKPLTSVEVREIARAEINAWWAERGRISRVLASVLESHWDDSPWPSDSEIYAEARQMLSGQSA